MIKIEGDASNLPPQLEELYRVKPSLLDMASRLCSYTPINILASMTLIGSHFEGLRDMGMFVGEKEVLSKLSAPC